MNTSFQIPGFIRSREPGTFFAGGIIAGFLLFLVWFAMLPSTGKKSFAAAPETSVAPGPDPLGSDGAILSAITGTRDAGQASVIAGEAGASFQDEQGMAPFEGESGNAPVDGEGHTYADGASIAPQGPQVEFLEAYAEVDGVRVPQPSVEPALQAWWVEVLREDGSTEVLQINAQSPGHALSIVRDYRGNPRVLRGPSTQALE